LLFLFPLGFRTLGPPHIELAEFSVIRSPRQFRPLALLYFLMPANLRLGWEVADKGRITVHVAGENIGQAFYPHATLRIGLAGRGGVSCG
jgi:hypothetical protein